MYQQDKVDVVSEYRALNQVAETGGIVMFGSTAAAQMPLNELMQDYEINVSIYNRSIKNLTIDAAEQYIGSCIASLKPKAILLHFGEEELLSSMKTTEEIIESYRWLLYQLHTTLPKSRLVIVSINEEVPDGRAYNEALRALAKEYGCAYTEGPSGSLDGTYALRFFHTLRSFFFDRTMTMADALRYYPMSS